MSNKTKDLLKDIWENIKVEPEEIEKRKELIRNYFPFTYNTINMHEVLINFITERFLRYEKYLDKINTFSKYSISRFLYNLGLKHVLELDFFNEYTKKEVENIGIDLITKRCGDELYRNLINRILPSIQLLKLVVTEDNKQTIKIYYENGEELEKVFYKKDESGKQVYIDDLQGLIELVKDLKEKYNLEFPIYVPWIVPRIKVNTNLLTYGDNAIVYSIQKDTNNKKIPFLNLSLTLDEIIAFRSIYLYVLRKSSSPSVHLYIPRLIFRDLNLEESTDEQQIKENVFFKYFMHISLSTKKKKESVLIELTKAINKTPIDQWKTDETIKQCISNLASVDPPLAQQILNDIMRDNLFISVYMFAKKNNLLKLIDENILNCDKLSSYERRKLEAFLDPVGYLNKSCPSDYPFLISLLHDTIYKTKAIDPVLEYEFDSIFLYVSKLMGDIQPSFFFGFSSVILILRKILLSYEPLNTKLLKFTVNNALEQTCTLKIVGKFTQMSKVQNFYPKIDKLLATKQSNTLYMGNVYFNYAYKPTMVPNIEKETKIYLGSYKSMYKILSFDIALRYDQIYNYNLDAEGTSFSGFDLSIQ